MTADVLDHAARLLEHEASHCMNARLLHLRTSLDTGDPISLDAFVAALRRHGDRFAVVAPAQPQAGSPGWAPGDVDAYADALAATASASPLIMLVAPPARQRSDALAAVHIALIELLQATSAGDQLHEAAAAGVQELEALRCGLAR